MTHIIVFGNNKGGSGKTTIAMHSIIGLLHDGYSVTSIDLDATQQSLTKYIANRNETAKTIDNENKIIIPNHFTSNGSVEDFLTIINQSKDLGSDFIIIDTAGSSSSLNEEAHLIADIIITPINDSFMDVDLIGSVNPEDFATKNPGIYSNMIWAQKIKKASKYNHTQHWIVVRNRISPINTKNKLNIQKALTSLSKRYGFYIGGALTDRVIFKELFLEGLTILDISKHNKKIKMNISTIAAKQEIRDIVNIFVQYYNSKK